MRVIFFWKVRKILSKFQKCRRKFQKFFSFLNKCIWIDCVNLSLLRTENLWPAVNVFTKSPKIFHITKRDFFQLSFLYIDWYKYAEGSLVRILAVFGFLYYAVLRRIFRNGTFKTFIWWRFSESVISKILQLWGSSFFKNFKILSAFQKCRQEKEKVFPFRGNFIGIGCVQLSLLRREYLWPADNVLKNSPKIFPITKKDFFELNCLHRDQ